jgi:hypothetical protein
MQWIESIETVYCCLLVLLLEELRLIGVIVWLQVRGVRRLSMPALIQNACQGTFVSLTLRPKAMLVFVVKSTALLGSLAKRMIIVLSNPFLSGSFVENQNEILGSRRNTHIILLLEFVVFIDGESRK